MKKYGPSDSVYTFFGIGDAGAAIQKGSMGSRIDVDVRILQKGCSDKTYFHLSLECLWQQGWHGHKL